MEAEAEAAALSPVEAETEELSPVEAEAEAEAAELSPVEAEAEAAEISRTEEVTATLADGGPAVELEASAKSLWIGI